jgi:beta-galactosidase
MRRGLYSAKLILMGKLEILKDGLKLDGKDFYLASGDMHYFRIMPGGWKRRLELMKDFGLTAVQTYIPWNMHEPEKGKFKFEGILNLRAFIEMVDDTGLKVMLRPSPYICSEWDMGGLPSWLLKSGNICLRSTDPEFMDHVKSYTERLCKEFVPYLSTNGGPVIAVAIENEYGSYGTDREYLSSLMEFLSENGVNVPFYTASGYDIYKLFYGNCKDTWAGVDYRTESALAISKLREYQPDKPPLVCEYWDGRAMHWGREFSHREGEPVAKAYREALDLGAYVNFYMFCGGTSFGFMSGASYVDNSPGEKYNPQRYVPHATSYDVDAVVSENGVPTPKYYACRRELDQYLGKPERKPNPPEYRTQEIRGVSLTEIALLFDNLENLAERTVKSANVKTMEELGQDYGFILYSKNLEYTDDRVRRIHIDDVHDRATVYVNGKYIGTYTRDEISEPIEFVIPKEGLKLDILVENCGRIKYGYMLADRKGITKYVRFDIVEPGNKGLLYNKGIVMNWTIYTLPMRDLTQLEYKSISSIYSKCSVIRESLSVPGNDIVSGGVTSNEIISNDNDREKYLPAFYRGEFIAKAGIDTFIHMKGWVKGNVWINGFNIGRYWDIGPQETLYVPGELLRDGRNEIQIFEIHRPAHDLKVDFIGTHIIDGPIKESSVEM